MSGPTETPEKAARRLSASAIRDGYKPQALHTYTRPDCSVWYWRIRLKSPETGDKWIRPMRRNGAGYELGEPDFPGGKPLYRLNDLAARPHDGVMVVEGERKADALAKAGVLATTSGAADSAAKADWRPLAGRDATIWPDNDVAGQRYAVAVGDALLALGCTLRVIDVEKLGLPPKGDAVDWLKANPAVTAAGSISIGCLNVVSRPMDARRRVRGKSEGDPVSYLDRLKKGHFPANCPTEVLTKLTEAPFVSSVSTRVGQKKPQTPLSRASKARPRKVLALLARDGVRYAVLVEDPSTDPVVMAVATPNGTREVLIPRDQYDPFEVLAKVGRWDTGRRSHEPPSAGRLVPLDDRARLRGPARGHRQGGTH